MTKVGDEIYLVDISVDDYFNVNWAFASVPCERMMLEVLMKEKAIAGSEYHDFYKNVENLIRSFDWPTGYNKDFAAFGKPHKNGYIRVKRMTLWP